MPNAAKKIYAVRVGREGPQIYDSWAEVKFLWSSVETSAILKVHFSAMQT
jgi:hypothetical protein